MKAAAVHALKAEHPLPLLLQIAQLARSTYDYHRGRPSRPDPYAALKVEITRIFEAAKGRYGHRRIHVELVKAGWHVAKKTVLALMRALNLICHVRRRKHQNAAGGAIGAVAENLLNRNFSADVPNQAWVTDVTEFHIGGQTVYLSPVMDLFDRQILTYTVGRSPSHDLVLPALREALATLQVDEHPLVHTDQGQLYQSLAWQRTVTSAGAIPSMSRKGNCLDNAVIESFFSHLKTEMFHHHRFTSVTELMSEIPDYIAWYNRERISAPLLYMSPVEYRAHVLAA